MNIARLLDMTIDCSVSKIGHLVPYVHCARQVLLQLSLLHPWLG